MERLDRLGRRGAGPRFVAPGERGAVVLEECGNLFGLDLVSGDAVPAVYFFDHETEFAQPEWAAGSSLGTFLLILADVDRAYAEHWPRKWALQIDPDIDSCPRVRAIWAAG